MGLSAKFYVEVFSNLGTWVHAHEDKVVVEVMGQPDVPIASYGADKVYDDDGFWALAKYNDVHPFDPNQSYDFYGAFVGIRNYHNVEPLLKVRGIPKDASSFVSYRYNFDLNGTVIGPYYLTLKEIYDLPWDTEVTCMGYVSNNYAQGRTELEEEPEGYSRDSNDFQNILVTWKSTYGNQCRNFLKLVDENLKPLAVDPANLRLVFWFT